MQSNNSAKKSAMPQTAAPWAKTSSVIGQCNPFHHKHISQAKSTLSLTLTQHQQKGMLLSIVGGSSLLRLVFLSQPLIKPAGQDCKLLPADPSKATLSQRPGMSGRPVEALVQAKPELPTPDSRAVQQFQPATPAINNQADLQL